jgi:hypothetical protein
MLQISTRDYGKLCRNAVKKHLNETWGKLNVEGSWLKSQKNNNKILTIYSNLHNDKWFYGIMQDYWNNWDYDKYLSIIMRDGNYCSYILLSPDEVIYFLSRINQSKDNQKKFNIRIPSIGKIYIGPWPDFPFESRIINIGKIDPEDAIIEKFSNKLKKTGLSINELKNIIGKVMGNNS